MTFFEYCKPILKYNSNKRCIVNVDKNCIFVGKIGDIPSKYLVYEYDKVLFNGDTSGNDLSKNEYLIIYLKNINNINNINNNLGILGGV